MLRFNVNEICDLVYNCVLRFVVIKVYSSMPVSSNYNGRKSGFSTEVRSS